MRIIILLLFCLCCVLYRRPGSGSIPNIPDRPSVPSRPQWAETTTVTVVSRVAEQNGKMYRYLLTYLGSDDGNRSIAEQTSLLLNIHRHLSRE